MPGLADAIRDGELWQLPVTLVPHPEELDAFLAEAQTMRAAGLQLAFATRDVATGTLVGSTRFMKIDRANRRLEIGFTFIAASWQRSHVNTEAKLLMLTHAFETWYCNRVELLTDVLNARSRAAIERIGATFEGVLRQHMVMRDGRIRDTALYSIVRPDWAGVRARLQARVAPG